MRSTARLAQELARRCALRAMLVVMRRAASPVEIRYTEIAPPADLAPYVDRLWLRTTVHNAAGRVHRVLPDGCVDVIVHADRGTAELVGTMPRALEVADGPAELIAARFKPGTAAALARCPLAELTDRQADLAALGIAGDLAGRGEVPFLQSPPRGAL